ncbi:hypothetical protein V6N12_043915 [Hibiscus sabdariffa]|uniref:Uncharacterized protein n=1 Tax=Hibiscus sabdariffa TaxID=183260 RepID=A0ABR2DFQ9_9ROSI
MRKMFQLVEVLPRPIEYQNKARLCLSAAMGDSRSFSAGISMSHSNVEQHDERRRHRPLFAFFMNNNG